MQAGALRHVIEIQAKSVTRDTGGGVASAVWTTIADGVMRAKVLITGSVERYVGNQLQHFQTFKIYTRFRDDVSPANRVLYNGLTLEILSAADWGGRRRESLLECLERRAA